MSTTPTPLSHTEIEELLGAYALDAVEPETAAIIEAHLEGCVRCAIEVGQHHEVTGLLANSGGTAPAALWGGIARQLDGTSDQSWDRLAARLDVPGGDGAGDRVAPGAPAPVVPIDSGRRRSRWASAGAGLVAAAAAVLALVFGLQVHHLNGQVNALQAAPQLSAAERAALASPTTRKIPLAATSSTGSGHTPATIVLTAAGTGFVIDDTGPTSCGAWSVTGRSRSACSGPVRASCPSAWPGASRSPSSPSPARWRVAWWHRTTSPAP